MVNRMNINKPPAEKRKSSNNLTTMFNTNKKILKQRKLIRNLPPLPAGLGMSCTRPGYIRYLNEIQKYFENRRYNGRRIHVRFMEYYDDIKTGAIANNSSQIINRNPTIIFNNNSTPFPQINSNPVGIYYFIITAQKREGGVAHAINVLVDPNRLNPRIWAFDPHGASSMNSNGFGSLLRSKIIPSIKKLFGNILVNRTNVRTMIYNGPNLQARNERGVCTTFHISFSEVLLDLLNEKITISDLGRIIPNNPNFRSWFLNRPGPLQNVINKEVTKVNLPISPMKMTMGRSNKLKKVLRKR